MFNRAGGHLVITEEGIRAINNTLGNLALESGAKAVMLLDKGGQLIAAQGETNSLDTLSLSALITGSFNSTKAIASLLGETEFKIMFQQGTQSSLFMMALGTNDMVAVIFPNSITVGKIKYKCLQVAELLDSQMKAMYANTPDAPFRKPPTAQPKINDLF
jgi:predicted regulator of Ras-like GTPase activity (Roadblock/LC7/MglB family)